MAELKFSDLLKTTAKLNAQVDLLRKKIVQSIADGGAGADLVDPVDDIRQRTQDLERSVLKNYAPMPSQQPVDSVVQDVGFNVGE